MLLDKCRANTDKALCYRLLVKLIAKDLSESYECGNLELPVCSLMAKLVSLMSTQEVALVESNTEESDTSYRVFIVETIAQLLSGV